jgi:type II secretory pathway predicted ATPase ExeA
MYDSFYNLSEKPFRINTDPRFLWLGEKHQEALANLEYGLVNHNGLVVLTGDIGTGKTTLVNAFLDALSDKVCVAKINHTNLEPEQFLSLMAKTFDPNVVASGKSDLLLFFHGFLKKEHANGRIVLLIVDEAHHLSAEIFEEIRLLTNIEQGGKSLLNVMFVGQRELMPILLSHQCRALRQRITLFYNIEALTREETALYVGHRLRVSGTPEPLFSPAAINKIYAFTGGNPRTINLLCDRALLTGYVTGAHFINKKIITECAYEIDLLRKGSISVFLTVVDRIRACGVFLLREAAKAFAEMKTRKKPASAYRLARLHSMGGILAESVLSRFRRSTALARRNIVMGLTASALPFLFVTWTLYAFSVADGQEPDIALKQPKPAFAELAPVIGNQEQKAAVLSPDPVTGAAAEFVSSSSKPEVRKAATTAANMSFTDETVAISDRVNTASAESNAGQAIELVDANEIGGPAVWGRGGGADAQRLLLKNKAAGFSHQVKWPQETLYSIALWYTGSGEYWKEIAAANPSIAPTQIHIGDTITIPPSLIRTHVPMPLGFLESRGVNSLFLTNHPES